MPSSRLDKEFSVLMESNTDVTVLVNTNALDEAISWISSNLSPEDIFSEKELSSWAESNGYVKE